jgi:hypothetical protein
MLWYLADGSLNDYLKSQVVLQGEYYSGQQTTVENVKFSTNTGVLTLEQLTMATIKNTDNKKSMVINQALVQLAPVDPEIHSQKNSNSISKKVQHIIVENVVIDKLSFNLIENIKSNKTTNLERLQQEISEKLAADYPVLYPEIAAKSYAKQHPELNVELANNTSKGEGKNEAIETNQAVIEVKAAKQQKRILGKAATRITILSFTIKSIEINNIAKDNNIRVQHFNNVTLPVVGEANGLASNQIGGEILRLLLLKLSQLQKTDSRLPH